MRKGTAVVAYKTVEDVEDRDALASRANQRQTGKYTCEACLEYAVAYFGCGTLGDSLNFPRTPRGSLNFPSPYEPC